MGVSITSSALKNRYERTVLVLGPPHSGKSAFAYLLFKALREVGNDAALLDCDIPSPTFRRYDILSNEENQHAYLTPNYSKPTEEINPEMYENIIDLNLAAVIEKGIIVMDGLGKHSRLTDALIKRSKALIVLSKHNLTQDEMKSSNYVINGNPTHPFTFYRGALRIRTYTSKVQVYVNIDNFEGQLYGLSRSGIHHGDVTSIPKDTLSEIRKVASYIHNYGLWSSS